MGASVFKFRDTGTKAIALSAPVAVGACSRLVSVSVHLSAAPVTAGSLSVTLDAAEGSDYDTLLQSASMVGLTDWVWLPDQDVLLTGGDAVKVAYANADKRTFGVRVTLKAV